MKIIAEVEFIGKPTDSPAMTAELRILIIEGWYNKGSLKKFVLSIHDYINAKYSQLYNLNININWKLTFLMNLRWKWYVKARDKRLKKLRESRSGGANMSKKRKKNEGLRGMLKM